MIRTLLRGRSAEVGTAHQVLADAAAARQCAVVVVSGEPGMGKTALLESMVAQAERAGYVVGAGKAEELDQISPMAPLLLALRSSRPPLLSADDFAALGPLFDQQLWLVDRLAATLEDRSQDAPLLVAVDDVQWADPLTLFALRLLPRRVATSPIVWLLTVRPDSPGVSDLAAAVGRDVPVRHIELGPLSREAMLALAEDRLDRHPGPRLTRLLEGAGGNPFLAVELVEGLVNEALVDGEDLAPTGQKVPTRLRHALRGRMHGSRTGAWELLRVGSVLGDTFNVEDAAALLREPTTTLLPKLEDSVRDGLLLDDGHQVAFRHDLIREAAYEDLAPSARRVLHRSAAEHLLATGRSAVEAAHHLMVGATAGDRQAAGVLRHAAADVVPRTPTTAVNLITRAYKLLNPRDPLKLEVGQDVVDVFVHARRVQDAISAADELLRSAPDNETAARIQSQLARPLWDLGVDEELLARVDAALRLDGVSAPVHALLLAQRALALARGDDPEGAREAGSAALMEAEQLGHRDARATALRALGHAATTDGRFAAALDHFQQVRALLGGLPQAGELVALGHLDRYEEARWGLADARRQAEEHGGAWEVPAFGWWQAALDLAAGRLDEAEAGALTIVGLAEDLQEYSYRVQAYSLLARIALLRGDLRQADRHLHEVRRWRRSEVRLGSAQGALAEALYLDASGNPAGAAHLLADAADSPAALTRHTYSGYHAELPIIVRIARNADDPDLARRAARLAELYAERNPGVPTIQGAAAHARGLVADDVELLDRAATLLRDSPRPLSRAMAVEDHGRVLLAHGHRDAAVEQLDLAWDTFVGLGATGEARRVQRRLQTAGVRRRRWLTTASRPRSGWPALTETERRVAQLIAEGRTNRAVAQALFLSPNTVGTHLRSIFGKLRVNSRVQLTRVVLEHA
ncbi:AAA family ATPase [Actinopolymorpha sp. B9G3]|uniref:helix-turn-helix transcriptional regulator n=1 Tax=Actinopolymorpha sp. B9G3 TaxID=3158970 RepID=UPI0032D8B79A